MLTTILGLKMKMGAEYVQDNRIPVTLVKAGPCVVTQIKKEGRDGYWAVQLGFGTRRLKHLTKPLQGHLKVTTKDHLAPRYLKEIKTQSEPTYAVGDVIRLEDVLKPGDVLAVSGISKGKGFAGVVKRWHFSGGPKTHGQSDRQRHPGSIGQGTTPGRVYKGKHMAGRMGSELKTVKNLYVVSLNKDTGVMAVSGALPGRTGALLVVHKIKSGKLEELIEETPQVVVETEAPKEEVKPEEAPKEVGHEN